MKIIDLGHHYILEGVGGGSPQELIFVKNEGEKYPGTVGHHPGIQTQNLIRVCIDRTEYLNDKPRKPFDYERSKMPDVVLGLIPLALIPAIIILMLLFKVG